MGRIVILILGLSLIIERVTEKALYILSARNKKVYSWVVSTCLGLLISFAFRFGLLGELGLSSSSHIPHWIDYFITGLLLASGSEPVHSVIDVLALKKDELKRKKAKIA